jgi:Sec-independent protein translocase protein TatA
MFPAPIALFGDLGFQELLLVALAAVMIFGRRLPEVAGQAYGQFTRLRRSLGQMWRDTGIEDELRRIQRDVDRDLHRDPPARRLPERPPIATVAREPVPPPVAPPGAGEPPTPTPEPPAVPEAAPAEQPIQRSEQPSSPEA